MDRAGATGLTVSVVGHATLFALLSLALINVTRTPPPEQSIEVSFVDQVGPVNAAPEPAHEAPAIGAAPDPGPVEDTTPAPTPTPPRPLPPEPPAPVAPQPRAAPTPPPPRPAPPHPSAQPGTGSRTSRPLTGDILRGIGDDRVSTSNRAPAAMTGEARATIRSLIGAALRPCARQPLPAPEAIVMTVNYSVTLSRDGSLADVQFVRVNNSSPDLARYEQRMRELGVAVLRSCTPIRGLPPEYYDVPGGWRQFPYVFNPRAN